MGLVNLKCCAFLFCSLLQQILINHILSCSILMQNLSLVYRYLVSCIKAQKWLANSTYCWRISLAWRRLPFIILTFLPFLPVMWDGHRLPFLFCFWPLNYNTFPLTLCSPSSEYMPVPQCQFLLQGIHRIQDQQVFCPNHAPVTVMHLLLFFPALFCQFSPFDTLMIWATCTASFFGILQVYCLTQGTSFKGAMPLEKLRVNFSHFS